MSTVTKEIGFIFINEKGLYAYVCQSGGFTTKELVDWTNDLNCAEIFPHENIARRKHKQLEKCQALKASATRNVAIGEWEATPEPPPERPVMPGMPIAQPWEHPDKKRRAVLFNEGKYRYFDDNESVDGFGVGAVEYINADAKLIFS